MTVGPKPVLSHIKGINAAAWDRISAQNDSPNGGLRRIRERNGWPPEGRLSAIPAPNPEPPDDEAA